MNLRTHSIRWLAALVAMAALLLAAPAPELPDHLTAVTSNPHTGAPATLELDRYSLRAPNWEARIYSSPTTYSVLPANLDSDKNGIPNGIEFFMGPPPPVPPPCPPW